MEDLDGPIVDWNQYQIAMEAFGVCDLDGTEGLTWQEIEACEVIHIMFLKILSTNFCTVNHILFLGRK